MTTQLLPLNGLRVLDLGIISAGAGTAALLADAGAHVMKVESARYQDPFRAWSGTAGDAEQSSPQFKFTNRNKRGLGLDLKSDADRATFLRLVEKCDVVLENFRRGVLPRLGLGWDALSAHNPRIVLASISSQGDTGPDRFHRSYGSSLEACSGMASITGYPDGAPVISGRHVNYPDQVVSLFAAGAIIAAARDAKQSGRGVHLDISQREVASFLIGDMMGKALHARGSSNPGIPRHGNADPSGHPRPVVVCSDGRYVAVNGLPAGETAEKLTARAQNMASADLVSDLAAKVSARSACWPAKRFCASLPNVTLPPRRSSPLMPTASPSKGSRFVRGKPLSQSAAPRLRSGRIMRKSCPS